MFIVLAYFGLLPSSLFGWSAGELALYGLAATAVSGLGALAMAQAPGLPTRTVVSWALLVFGIGASLMLSIAPGSIAFGLVDTDDRWLQQAIFVAGALLVAASIGPLEAGQRALMIDAAPGGLHGERFGLYTTATKLTTAFGPLTVGIVVIATGNLRQSMLLAVVLLAAAWIAMRLANDLRPSALSPTD